MAIWAAEIKELWKLCESLKGQLPHLEKELEQLVRAEDVNVVMLYSRRCLEVLITDLCECELKRPRKTEPLQGIIDKLHKEEKVPSHIVASMQSLNSLSTFGTHPKDFDPEQVKPVLVNLDIIIKWYLKYKETGTRTKAIPAERMRQAIEITEDKTKIFTGSRKRLAGILGATIAIIVTLFTVLLFTGIIGSDRHEKEPDKSIAVLPFRNLSNDTTQLYFSDGIVEAILNYLSKVGELKVISSTSTKRYRNTELSIKEIARELGVASILEGSVQKTGNNVRITAQLIDAGTDTHLWSEIYDKDISDIFAIQSEVAQNVARELKATLTSEEKERINENQTENPEAYNFYLQGRFFILKRTKEGFRKSIEYFEKAVSADPDYALAYAGLADAYFLIAWWGWSKEILQLQKSEVYSRSKEYAYQALKIDKNLAEAHTVLGGILTYVEWKWEEARKELQYAVRLNPNFVTAHTYYSELLDILRENSEARKQINLALALDPFVPWIRGLSALYYLNEGKFRESLDDDLKGLEIASNDSAKLNWRFLINYIGLGENLKAVDVLQNLLRRDKLTANDAMLAKEVFNKTGISGLWNWLIELELKKSTPDPGTLAAGYAAVGKKEEALYWLEKYFETGKAALPRINNDPEFEILRPEPGFQSILKKMGLSEYQIPK